MISKNHQYSSNILKKNSSFFKHSPNGTHKTSCICGELTCAVTITLVRAAYAGRPNKPAIGYIRSCNTFINYSDSSNLISQPLQFQHQCFHQIENYKLPIYHLAYKTEK